jgi:hypothetical protein
MAGMVRRFLDRRSPDGDAAAELGRLCAACVHELPVAAAAVSRLRGGHHRGVVASAGPHVDALVALQQRVGDGPGLEADASRAAVSEPSLADSGRWPRYRPDAVAVGVAACFSFPIQLGVARFGTLDLLASEARPLSAGDRSEALVAADVASSLLAGLTESGSGSGAAASLNLLGERSVVHQAAGIASVQLDTSIEDAYLALQTRAHDDHVTVDHLAADLVAHQVSLEPAGGKH